MMVMKKKNNRGILKTVCIAAALVFILLSAASCAERVKDPVLEYEDSKISLSMYEFMLSRMKGTLARNKYDVTPLSEFWQEKHGGSELSNEEYYNQSILENCKNYLAALVMFEKEGLSLSQSTLQEIDEEISFYIDYDCGGSEEKLDTLLSKYGTDAEELRRIYEIEAKYNAVLTHLYGEDGSQISDSVKDEYYRANYYRFKQIIVSNFYYEYQTDENGDIIYFDSESGLPVYDSENGKYAYDEKGNRLEDEYGVDIMFGDDGKYLYDKEKGYPAPVADEEGHAIKHMYSESEMNERVAKIADILDAASNGNTAAFEALMPEWEVYVGAGDYYKDGYYLSDLESGGYSDEMLEILNELKEMENGDISVIGNKDSGYHIIMKYELDSGKFSDSEYAEWFSSFNSSLITKLFLDKCESFYGDITVNTENLEKAVSIKSVGTNYDY